MRGQQEQCADAIDAKPKYANTARAKSQKPGFQLKNVGLTNVSETEIIRLAGSFIVAKREKGSQRLNFESRRNLVF